MAELDFNIKGLEELAEDLQRLTSKYPDKAGDLLRVEARTLRQKVARRMQREKKSRKKTKKPLENVGSYKVSPVQGLGHAQYVEISAKAPHFHLVEHGHDLVRGGQTVGHVQGTHYFENTVREQEAQMPLVVGRMVDKLLREEGF